MSRAKKIILILGVLVGMMASVYFYLDNTRKEIDAVVQPMIREMVASHWDRSVIEGYSTEPFKQSQHQNNEQYEAMLEDLRTLGPINDYKGVQEFTVRKNKDEYLQKAGVLIDFEQVSAIMIISLKKIEDKWLMQGFKLKNAEAE